MSLRSPISHRPLHPDTSHSLSDGAGERWPVVDAIPYLRTSREQLAEQALARLDAGDRAGALVVLLADQDDWWPGPAADPARLAILVRDADTLSFRAAMDHLGFGRVGDYFAHRWSDPTYLAGLALMEAHWPVPGTAFELACGAGHYLRELTRRGVRCSGGDVVFAKLWLARHWIVGAGADLVCFDAASPWPIGNARFDLVACHDALYFLEPKAAIVDRLRALGGVLAIAHIHNRECANFSSGSAVTADELTALFPHALAYDDADLTRALVSGSAPRPCALTELRHVEAFSLVEGWHGEPAATTGGLAVPPRDARLARNPLYDSDGAIRWPSKRYRDEYASRATYPARSDPAGALDAGTQGVEAMLRSRELVDLPERW